MKPEEIAAKNDLLALIAAGGVGPLLVGLIDKESLIVLLPPRAAIDAIDTSNSEAVKDAVLFHFFEQKEFSKSLGYCLNKTVQWSKATSKNGKDVTIWCMNSSTLASDEILSSELPMPGYTIVTPYGKMSVHRVPRLLQPSAESSQRRFGTALRIDMAAWGFSADDVEPVGLVYVGPNNKDESLKALSGNEAALAVYAIGVLHSALSAIARVAHSNVTSDYDNQMMRFQKERMVKTTLIIPAGKAFLSSRLKGLIEFAENERGKLDGKNGSTIVDIARLVVDGPAFTSANIEPLLKKSSAFGKLPGRIAYDDLKKLMASIFANGNTDEWSKVLMYSLIGFIELRSTKFVNAENWFDKATNVAVGLSLN